MTIATTDDVAVALGRTLTTEEEARAEQLLEIASGAVKDWTGFYFEPGEYTIGRIPRGGKLRIPAVVDSVESVVAVDQCNGSETAVNDYTLRGSTLYGLWFEWAEVEFTVVAEPPADAVAVVAGVVANTISSPDPNVASEAVGPFSRSFVSSSGRVYFAASDKAALRKYKQPKPAIQALR